MPVDLQWTALERSGLEHVVASADADGFRADSHDGRWLADGYPRRDLDGCSDIDISLTPLTNTLPIRRPGWSPWAARDLAVAYVSAHELSVRPVRQRHTLLSRDEQCKHALYRYESGSFRAVLTVDGDGIVTCYPGLWRRVDPGAGAAAWGPSSRRRASRPSMACAPVARTRVARRR